jgi:glycosyltransferase involved in cell wall biosynthesis
MVRREVAEPCFRIAPRSSEGLRIVVHDYSGHPGQVNLSRTLAGRGHTVVHQYCPSYQTGTGAVERLPEDPATFDVEQVALAASFARYTIFRRIRQELQYGALAARSIRTHDPDVALLSNIPLLSLLIAAVVLRRSRIPFVFWQQDVYSAAIRSAAERRVPPLAGVIGALARRFERHVARSSACVVPIDDSFVPVLRGWGVSANRIHVVPNWAPIAELPMRARDNDWARRNGLTETPVVLYTGTLGIKHDPSLLVVAARGVAGEATVAVVSEGLGRALLDEEVSHTSIDNLRLFDFQPYEDLPDIMASADILIAILEPEASVYSVPSKVLSYLCAGRPIVAVIPSENSVARIVREADAGRLVRPGDGEELVTTIKTLLGDETLRSELGANARRYAEKTFDSETVASRFEQILTAAAS